MKRGYIHMVLVLDRSGSMETIRDATIEGVNGFFSAHKKVSGRCTLTLVQFDAPIPRVTRAGMSDGWTARLPTGDGWRVGTNIVYHVPEGDEAWYKRDCDFLPIAEVRPLDHATYQPRNGTALLDAMARAIRETGERLSAMPEAERPEKVLFATMTDGEENSSRTTSKGQVFEMVEHQRTKYGWEFLFLGANQDAIAQAGALGYKTGGILNVGRGAAGMSAAFGALTVNTVHYRVDAASAGTYASTTLDGFTDAQRQEQEDAGAVKTGGRA